MVADHADEAPEPRAVNTSEPWERAYWARRFMVPVEQVIAAVAAVGDDPAQVASHLGRDWPGHETIT
ncbi:DUF3606 domain-containing protein [Methylobacterium gregans]|uniref:DUF3606 domain-containing protein n=1 Tax=Methylobacterium gregans TaxID=374424 RepID=A0AA37HNG9_9HYPH|nr:DUF3606 domain-containing protein [Methylobacterium gregans]MDQ0519388.1 hypothetical protein [Methylobacterium gregans]GJD78680.1 hypothetical protein NBEOAGPD_1898 [Methylobacterium gregans]GLS52971.1 hypothetical protein GCM10007886_11540 [Methylobacterium gregans]